VPRRRLLALADDLLDLLADRLQADAKRLERLGRHTLALVDEAEQDVLRADVVVIERPGFFLRPDDNPPRPVGKPFEHRVPHSAVGRRDVKREPRLLRALVARAAGTRAQGCHPPPRTRLPHTIIRVVVRSLA
jgi:hypothetical protein